jgi:hypothetical protein
MKYYIINFLIKHNFLKIDFIKKYLTKHFANKLADHVVRYTVLEKEYDLMEVQRIYNEINKIKFVSNPDIENAIYLILYNVLYTSQIGSFNTYKMKLVEISDTENISLMFDYVYKFRFTSRIFQSMCEDLSYNQRVDVLKYF